MLLEHPRRILVVILGREIRVLAAEALGENTLPRPAAVLRADHPLNLTWSVKKLWCAVDYPEQSTDCMQL